MKRYTYPVNLYTSEGMFAFMLKDIDLVSAADTPEKAFEDLQDMLGIYLGLANRYGEDVPKATDFVLLEKETKFGKVLLVSTKIKQGKEE